MEPARNHHTHAPRPIPAALAARTRPMRERLSSGLGPSRGRRPVDTHRRRPDSGLVAGTVRSWSSSSFPEARKRLRRPASHQSVAVRSRRCIRDMQRRDPVVSIVTRDRHERERYGTTGDIGRITAAGAHEIRGQLSPRSSGRAHDGVGEPSPCHIIVATRRTDAFPLRAGSCPPVDSGM
jgi:hypothetical protein